VVSTAKREGPAEAGGFPGVLDIAVRKLESRKKRRGGFVSCPMPERLAESELQWDRFSTKQADLPIHDLIPSVSAPSPLLPRMLCKGSPFQQTILISFLWLSTPLFSVLL
jgi:hypothetical protein